MASSTTDAFFAAPRRHYAALGHRRRDRPPRSASGPGAAHRPVRRPGGLEGQADFTHVQGPCGRLRKSVARWRLSRDGGCLWTTHTSRGLAVRLRADLSIGSKRGLGYPFLPGSPGPAVGLGMSTRKGLFTNWGTRQFLGASRSARWVRCCKLRRASCDAGPFRAQELRFVPNSPLDSNPCPP